MSELTPSAIINAPQIMRMGIFGVNVCVPEAMSDAEIVAFVEKQYPCGTMNGWFVCEEGHDCLNHTPAVLPCDSRPGFVHKVLYC